MRVVAKIIALLVCATMLLVVGPPLVAGDTHHVVKGTQGPRGSATIWTYSPESSGEWYGHVVNSGLRSLIIDVDDITGGVTNSILHERVRFSDHRNSTVDTSRIPMAADREYLITAIPYGPKGSSCIIEDVFVDTLPDVASFTYVKDGLMVSVDASSSYDPDGVIVAWGWDWGDGTTGSGMTASHTYAAQGVYTIILTIVDNDGVTASTSQVVTVFIPPPRLVDFTYTITGYTVFTDASANYPEDIVSYAWDWGDGSTGSGVKASHTYATSGTYVVALTVTYTDDSTLSKSKEVSMTPGMPPVAGFTYQVVGFTVSVDGAASTDDHGIVDYAWDWGDGNPQGHGIAQSHAYTGSSEGGTGPPPTPFMIIGYVLGPDGGPALSRGIARIENTRTGAWMLVSVDPEYGFYMADLNILQQGFLSGDLVNVTLWSGGLVGYQETIATGSGAFIWGNVTLSPDNLVPQLETTITLTVTNPYGQTGSVSKQVVFAVP